MRVAITQPNFLPWLGYFDLLDQVDVWVSLDNVQRSKQSFASRNRIKLKSGSPRWLSVPLVKSPLDTTLLDQRIGQGDWVQRHIQIIDDNYQKAPHRDRYQAVWPELLGNAETSLSRYNEHVIRELSGILGLEFDFYRASELEPTLRGTPQEKVLSILSYFEATEFLNFQRGVEMGLYDSRSFQERGLKLLKQDYEHPTYEQLGETFVSHLSIVDLVLCEGPRALDVIRSGSRWIEITP